MVWTRPAGLVVVLFTIAGVDQNDGPADCGSIEQGNDRVLRGFRKPGLRVFQTSGRSSTPRRAASAGEVIASDAHTRGTLGVPDLAAEIVIVSLDSSPQAQQ